jgi:DNA repair exonuclease SbcCD ATPase subunit
VSKKPQRSRHRAAPVPWSSSKPVELSESYEREVQRSTEKLERDYRRALKRVEQAEARLARAKEPAKRRPAVKQHVLAQLEAEVAARREELEEFRRMMQASPASAAHRGTRSYRPVPLGRQDSQF